MPYWHTTDLADAPIDAAAWQMPGQEAVAGHFDSRLIGNRRYQPIRGMIRSGKNREQTIGQAQSSSSDRPMQIASGVAERRAQ